jgi:4'-phosphopantetheinyl transferase
VEWLVRGERDVPDGDAWLTPVEAQRAASMRFSKRRSEYRLRRYAGKCAIAASIGLPQDPASLARIGVLNAPTGAPYVVLDDRRVGTDVSLTDRAGWAVCLVGPDLGAVGCDLEIVEPRSDGFVRDFLTPGEQALVAAAPGPDGRDALANLVWSAKESALKVLRTGLRVDTRTVEVVLADPSRIDAGAGSGGERDGWQRLAVAHGTGQFPGWWRRDGVFLLTVVAASGVVDPPQVLPGSSDLKRSEPVHSWVGHPLVD